MTLTERMDQLQAKAIADLTMGKDKELVVLRLTLDVIKVVVDHYGVALNPTQKGGEV